MAEPGTPLKPRARVLVALFVIWVAYGMALLSRVLFAANNPILESVQRYAFVISLGLVAAYFSRIWASAVTGGITLLLGIVVGIVGRDWPLAGILVAAFVAACAAGLYLRRG